eukprot:Sro1790_g297760.1 protein ligase RNF126 (227) ;mRNA; r:19317-19997
MLDVLMEHASGDTKLCALLWLVLIGILDCCQQKGWIQGPSFRNIPNVWIPVNQNIPNNNHVPNNRNPPPAKPYLLETLPQVNVNEKDIATHIECPLCKEDLELGCPVVHLPCSHIYHDRCIEGWLLDKNCTCPLCLWEFPTDNESYNRGQTQRMKNRKPRYYWYELERTPVRELKQWLSPGDSFCALEKKELFQHLMDTQAIVVIDNPQPEAGTTRSSSKEVQHTV